MNRLTVAVIALCWLVVSAPAAALAGDRPAERVRMISRHDFAITLERLEQAVADNRLGLVFRANAQNGARAIGVSIPGNQVWGIFGPRYAVRMLKASVDAGFEAPVRLYIVESPAGQVTVSYIEPSAVFAPYRNAELEAMARELNEAFARIVSTIR